METAGIYIFFFSLHSVTLTSLKARVATQYLCYQVFMYILQLQIFYDRKKEVYTDLEKKIYEFCSAQLYFYRLTEKLKILIPRWGRDRGVQQACG